MRRDHPAFGLGHDADSTLPSEDDVEHKVAGLDVEDTFVADGGASHWCLVEQPFAVAANPDLAVYAGHINR